MTWRGKVRAVKLWAPSDVRNVKIPGRTNPLTGRCWYDANKVDELLDIWADQLEALRKPVEHYLTCKEAHHAHS